MRRSARGPDRTWWALGGVFLLAGVLAVPGGRPSPAGAAPLAQGAPGRINHVIVIYQENHGFDNYLGTLPGVDGLAVAGATAVQVDRQGRPYAVLPPPLANAVDGQRRTDPRFPADLPNGPFPFDRFVSPEDAVPSQIHAFYRQQYQIGGGRLDGFMAWTDAGAAVIIPYGLLD